MRKFTLFLALMVAMVTTAFAQGIDASKQYYLKSSGWAGTTKVTGYLNLSVGMVHNTHGLILEEKQALSIEEVWVGTNKAYVISAMLASGTSGEAKHYIAAPENGNASWQAVVTTDVNKALPLTFSQNTDGTYYISSAKGGFKLDKVDENSATDTRLGLYTNGNGTATAIWTLEEVATEPAGLTVVSQSPADNVQVESLSSITIEFNKAVKLDWAPSAGTGTDATGTGTGTDATGTGTGTDATGTGTGTGSVDHIKLKARDMSNAAIAWFSQAVVNGNKITFNFEAAVKTTGTYTFTIPADLIIAEEGDEKYAGGTFTFKVNAPVAPTFKSSSFEPKPDWIACYTLKYIKATFSENIEVVGKEALQLKNGEEVVATITKIEAEGKNLFLTLDEDKYITPEVTTEYSLVIPKGYVKTKGTDKGLANDVTVTGTVKARFMVKNIEPATTETVEAFENIVVEFNMAVNANTAKDLVLRNNENGEEVALTASLNEEGKVLTLTPTRPVVNGAYTLRQSGLATGNGLEAIAATGDDAIYQAPVYTITVAGPELDKLVPVSFDRNPLLTTYDGKYKLQGVKINFADVVKRYDTTTYDGDYGYILDADGKKVAKLDKCMGGNGTNNKFATPYSSTAITTPGTYKVVVYGGVIYSADGEAEYKGGEFEFTVEQHPVMVSPSAEDGLCYNEEFKQESEFREFVISVKYAAKVILDAEKKIVLKHIIKEGWQTVGEEEVAEATVTIADVDAVEKQIKITFPEQEYAEGSYTFDVPAALFTVDGEANAAYTSNTFTYKKPVLTITRNFDSWSFIDNVWDMPNSVIITIENAASVEVDEAKVATIAVGDDVYNATIGEFYYNEWSNAWYIQMYFEDFFAADFEFVKGDYTFTLPAGLYTVNGAANEEAVKTFTYGDAVVEEFSVTSILPASGNVLESLDAIAITFSNGYKPEILPIKCGEEIYKFILMSGLYVAVDNDYKVAAITKPGTYTLDLSELDGLTGNKVFTWTIEEGEATAIDSVNAEAENAVIYDLTGRRVEKITKAGVYVINGVKKVVK